MSEESEQTPCKFGKSRDAEETVPSSALFGKEQAHCLSTMHQNLPVQKVMVHPLVLLSIVDHFNRVSKTQSIRRVVGVLLGSVAKDKTLDIGNSFAVPFDEDDKDKNVWFLDTDYLESMYGMFHKVDAKEDVVGWYHTGPNLCENDISINEQLKRFTLNPVLLVVNLMDPADQLLDAMNMPFGASRERSGLSAITVLKAVGVAVPEREDLTLPSVAFVEVRQSQDAFSVPDKHLHPIPITFEGEEVALQHLLRELSNQNTRPELVTTVALRNYFSPFVNEVLRGNIKPDGNLMKIIAMYDILPSMFVENVEALLANVDELVKIGSSTVGVEDPSVSEDPSSDWDDVSSDGNMDLQEEIRERGAESEKEDIQKIKKEKDLKEGATDGSLKGMKNLVEKGSGDSDYDRACGDASKPAKIKDAVAEEVGETADRTSNSVDEMEEEDSKKNVTEFSLKGAKNVPEKGSGDSDYDGAEGASKPAKIKEAVAEEVGETADRTSNSVDEMEEEDSKKNVTEFSLKGAKNVPEKGSGDSDYDGAEGDASKPAKIKEAFAKGPGETAARTFNSANEMKGVVVTRGSALSQRITDLLMRLRGLHAQLKGLEGYLREVAAGNLPVNHAILCYVQEILDLLPDVTGTDFVEAQSVQTNDQLMCIYLGALVRSVIALDNLIENKLSRQKAEKEQNDSDNAITAGKKVNVSPSSDKKKKAAKDVKKK